MIFNSLKKISKVANTLPRAVEKALIKEFPDELIHKAHHWLILHGRYTCLARNPKCGECGLKEMCRYYAKYH